MAQPTFNRTPSGLYVRYPDGRGITIPNNLDLAPFLNGQQLGSLNYEAMYNMVQSAKKVADGLADAPQQKTVEQETQPKIAEPSKTASTVTDIISNPDGSKTIKFYSQPSLTLRNEELYKIKPEIGKE